MRKNRITFGASALCAMLVSACLQENGKSPVAPPAPVSGEAEAIQNRDFAAILQARGFKTEGMQEMSDGFLVEGDLYITKEDLLTPAVQPLAKSAQTRIPGGIMIDATSNRVRLQIHSSISAWTPEISQAVNAWNNANSGAHIYIVTTNPTTTIGSDTWTGFPPNMQNLHPLTCAATNYYTTSNPPPGRWVSINMDACGLSADPMERLRTITHELGHAIRLDHTDDTFGPQIPGTPTSDWSVMSTYHDDGPKYPSIWDRKALQILYPQDVPMFSTNLDLDTRDDITFWRPTNGTWYSLKSSTNFSSSVSRQWGARGDTPLGNTDIDGDGKSDLVYWRPDNATFYIRTSGSSYTNSLSYQWAGDPDVPMPAMNVDSDNKDDLVTWQWTSGNWNILTSSSGYTSSIIVQWGQMGDIPVPSTDLDFDGKEDLVIYRPSNGTWYVKKSSSNFTTSVTYQLGNITHIPLPGSDYDGDGKDDISILDPNGSQMLIRTSKSNFTSTMIWGMGSYGNTPIGETSVDADNLSDLLIWNRLDNVWRSRTQSSNFSYTPQWTWGS